MNAPAPATEIDSVPVYLAPPVDGRCIGGLTFRVGHADESLATSGISHITEHLALNFSDPTKVHSNGATGPNLTNFHIQGTQDEVVTFLNRVTESLRNPPLDRLETEKQILRAEAAQMRGGPADAIHGFRYGARGYGLPSYAELGLYRLTRDDVAAWVARCFTAGNAVAWIAAESVPDGLDLSLPPGPRLPVPPLDPWLPQAPAHYVGPDGLVVMTSLIPRSSAGRIFASVLKQALYRELRFIGGYSYSPDAGYDPIDAETAQLYAAADCLPEHQDEVVHGLVEVLARLRRGEMDSGEIAAAVENAREMLQHPDIETMRLPSTAADHLLGHESLSTEQLLAELDTIDAAALGDVALHAQSTALVQVPGRPMDSEVYAAVPMINGKTVPGIRFPFLRNDQHAIVVGPNGVAAEEPENKCAVRWDEMAVAARYPDGACTLVDSDGYQVHVEPNVLSRAAGMSAIEAIDKWLPPDAVVDMPAREAELIPQRPGILNRHFGPGGKYEGEAWALALMLLGYFAFLGLRHGLPPLVDGVGTTRNVVVFGFGVVSASAMAGIIGWHVRLWLRNR